MKQSLEILDQRLKKLDHTFQRRTLKPRLGMDFSSNDYLGFSRDLELRGRIFAQLRDQPAGATGSRLLRGHSEFFDRVEASLAAFVGREAALILPSGYQANLALLSGILTADDFVFSDQLNHASLIDGIRLSRAQCRVYPHKDLTALRNGLVESESRPGLKVIVTESLFGMDGDHAPLSDLVQIAEEFSALLIVDEAHATGLWGDSQRGGGLVQSLGLSHRVFATIHTGGKALGVGGAWIAGDAKLKDYLVNFSRPFIFSTAPIPALLVSLEEAVRYWAEVGAERAKRVVNNAAHLKSHLAGLNISAQDPSPIVPVILGENQTALGVAQVLLAQGFDVRAIRPPTVPQGTARLRICVQWDHLGRDLATIALLIKQALKEE